KENASKLQPGPFSCEDARVFSTRGGKICTERLTASKLFVTIPKHLWSRATNTSVYVTWMLDCCFQHMWANKQKASDKSPMPFCLLSQRSVLAICRALSRLRIGSSSNASSILFMI